MAQLLDSFGKSVEKKSYRIAPLAEFGAIQDVAERNKIYWSELLYRAHFGASAGLLRLREWFIGAQRALTDGNVLVLAASLRGFLESAADTFEGFSDVPETLASSHMIVRAAIAGTLNEFGALHPELENQLIHFAYARKLQPGEGPRLHEAKTARDCIAGLAESIPDVADIYATLCQFSHPAAPTIFRFGGRMTHSSMLIFDPHAGSEEIRELIQLSHKLERAVILGIAPCVMTLKILNAFDLESVRTPWADTVPLRGSEAWRAIEKRLSDPSPPQTASESEHSRIVSELEKNYQPSGKPKRRGGNLKNDQ